MGRKHQRPGALSSPQALESLLQLHEARLRFEEFCVPLCMLPATISNNVPGTDLTIGADTALNAIVEVSSTTPTCPSVELLKNMVKILLHLRT